MKYRYSLLVAIADIHSLVWPAYYSLARSTLRYVKRTIKIEIWFQRGIDCTDSCKRIEYIRVTMKSFSLSSLAMRNFRNSDNKISN